MIIKKLFSLFAILFAGLTFCGAIYVLSTHGEANAGYACVPMVFCIASLTAYRSFK